VDDVFSGRVDGGSVVAAGTHHVNEFFDVGKSMQSYRLRWREALRERRAPRSLRPVLTTSTFSTTG
jgi:hypothetical protein